MRTICFDIDGTLIDLDSKPRPEVIELLRVMQKLGYKVYVWSGGGIDYAKTWVNRLKLEDIEVIAKGTLVPDLAVDDMEHCSLGNGLIWVGPPTPAEWERD